MSTILTVEQVACIQEKWADEASTCPWDELIASHEALRAQVVALTAALRDTLTEIHLNLGCDPDCEEKRHVLLPNIEEENEDY